MPTREYFIVGFIRVTEFAFAPETTMNKIVAKNEPLKNVVQKKWIPWKMLKLQKKKKKWKIINPFSIHSFIQWNPLLPLYSNLKFYIVITAADSLFAQIYSHFY